MAKLIVTQNLDGTATVRAVDNDDPAVATAEAAPDQGVLDVPPGVDADALVAAVQTDATVPQAPEARPDATTDAAIAGNVGPGETVIPPTAPEPQAAPTAPDPGPATVVPQVDTVAAEVERPAPPPTETVTVDRLLVGAIVRHVLPDPNGTGDPVVRHGMVVQVILGESAPAYVVGWFNTDRQYAHDELEVNLGG